MAKRSGAACVRAGVAIMLSAALNCQAQDYDIVFKGGRVIDPESKLDAIRDVAVGQGKILAISESPLRGRTEIDARGLVVGPGFVDLHILIALGIPAIQVGPGGRFWGFHALDEGMDPSGGYKGVQAALLTALNLVGLEGMTPPAIPARRK